MWTMLHYRAVHRGTYVGYGISHVRNTMQVLCRAVESSGTFGAQQVVKNERGEEVCL